MSLLNKFCFLFFTFCFQQNTFAIGSDFVGNGGDVVFCNTGHPYHVKILEEMEAKEFLGLSPLQTDQDNYIDIIKYYLEYSLGNKFPYFSQELLKMAKHFETYSRMVYGKELADINDSEHQIIPQGCEIRQAARLQLRSPSSPFSYPERYIINGDIWNLLSATQKAILVLHEILYEIFLIQSFGEYVSLPRKAIPVQINSLTVRYMNALIFSGALQDKYPTDTELALALQKKLKYKWFEKAGYIFESEFSTYFESGRLFNAIPNSRAKIMDECIETDSFIFFYDKKHQECLRLNNKAEHRKPSIFPPPRGYEQGVLFTDTPEQKVWSPISGFKFGKVHNIEKQSFFPDICHKKTGECFSKYTATGGSVFFLHRLYKQKNMDKGTSLEDIEIKFDTLSGTKKFYRISYNDIYKGKFTLDTFLETLLKSLKGLKVHCDHFQTWDQHKKSRVFIKPDELSSYGYFCDEPDVQAYDL